MKRDIVVIGAGGHAKVVIDTIQYSEYSMYGLTDANCDTVKACMGYPVLGNDEILVELYLQNNVRYAAMGIGHIGYPSIRNKAYRDACQWGFCFPCLLHPSAAIAKSSIIGEGSLCAAQVTVNPEAIIGKLCIINSSAVIEHEVIIEDGVHIAPRAVVLGGARVGSNSFVGAGSVVLQGVSIGKNCIIGAGTIVLEDIEDGSVVVGNPGRVIKRR